MRCQLTNLLTKMRNAATPIWALPHSDAGADGGTRTHDLLFTKFKWWIFSRLHSLFLGIPMRNSKNVRVSFTPSCNLSSTHLTTHSIGGAR